MYHHSSPYPGIELNLGLQQAAGTNQNRSVSFTRKLLILAFTFSSVMVYAQKDSTQGWKTGGVISFNFGQAASKNWAAGAEKWSVSMGAILNVYANKKVNKWSWDNNLDLGYAFLNTQSQGFRKTDDKIYLVSKLGRAISKKVNFSLLLNFRTQFYDGYDYNYLGKGFVKRTSSFMAPGYVVFAPGIDWKPMKSLSIFVTPMSVRWILVTNKPYDYLFPGGRIPDSLKTPASGDYEKPKSVLYGVDPARKVKIEAGGFASVQFNQEVVKNVVYTSKLDLFSNYLKGYQFLPPTYTTYVRTPAKPQNVKVYWTNIIAMKVNKFLNATYGFDLIYDDDIKQFGPNNSPGAQLRSQLAVGFQVKF